MAWKKARQNRGAAGEKGSHPECQLLVSFLWLPSAQQHCRSWFDWGSPHMSCNKFPSPPQSWFIAFIDNGNMLIIGCAHELWIQQQGTHSGTKCSACPTVYPPTYFLPIQIAFQLSLSISASSLWSAQASWGKETERQMLTWILETNMLAWLTKSQNSCKIGLGDKDIGLPYHKVLERWETDK